MRSVFVVIVLVSAVVSAGASEDDAILGLWATDPEGGGGEAHVEVVRAGDGFSGRIIWLVEPVFAEDDDQGMAGQTKVDRENADPALRSRPVVGIEILEGFRYVGKNKWKDGTIYDPDNGKTYKCVLKLSDDVLKVRGYVGVSLLGRTTRWTRVKAED